MGPPPSIRTGATDRVPYFPPEDARENEYGLERGLRVLSSYPLPSGERVWIITEADRSSTSIITPDEY
jgi:hypothetical protein